MFFPAGTRNSPPFAFKLLLSLSTFFVRSNGVLFRTVIGGWQSRIVPLSYSDCVTVLFLWESTVRCTIRLKAKMHW